MKIGSRTRWRFIVRGLDGKIKGQSEVTPNVNTLEGTVFFLDLYYNLALNYTAAWFVGLATGAPMNPTRQDTAALITTGTPNPPTTNDWREVVDYSELQRQPVIWGAVNVLTPTIPYVAELDQVGICNFTMTAAGILEGGLLSNDSGKGATSGILYCIDAGAGSLVYGVGDTIEVSVITGFSEGPV